MIDREEWRDGKLDEIVASGGAHLEHMGGRSWFLEMFKRDGSSIAVWFKSKDLVKPFHEYRDPPKRLKDD